MSTTGSNAARLTLIFFALVFFSLPRAASADAFEDAREVFGEAQKLYAAGEYGEAADRYRDAYRLMRSPLLFFNIAQARRLQFQRDGDPANLVRALEHYRRFLAEADPEPAERARAEANLREVETVSSEEARKRFASAEQALRLGRYLPAIRDYELSYELSGLPGLLFNLAQAQRKQFHVDGKLARLARAEDLLLTYRREAEGRVAPETIEQILGEIRGERATYHRKREAEARAKEPPAMRDARERYQQGDAAGALAALDVAEKIPGNERIVLVQLYRLRGQAAALAGSEADATEAFKRYLALEPAADATALRDEAEPAFAAAKAFWKGKSPLKIEQLPPGKVPPGARVTIPIRVASDPLRMIARRELRYRREGSSKWESQALTGDASAAVFASMPPPLVGKEYRMEYYALALDENGAVLDVLGSESAPLAFLVTEDAIVRPPPIYKRWWFWAAAGAVVAGTVATIAIVRDDGLPDVSKIGDVSGALR